MRNTNRTMEQTMEQMLANEGYVVKVAVTPLGYVATTHIENTGQGKPEVEMTLKYGLDLTPGDIVFQVRSVLDRLNGK